MHICVYIVYIKICLFLDISVYIRLYVYNTIHIWFYGADLTYLWKAGILNFSQTNDVRNPYLSLLSLTTDISRIGKDWLSRYEDNITEA